MICARWWMGILAVLSFSIAGADEAVLTVLHSNDVYGQLTRRDGQGGMAARVQIMRDLSQTGVVVVLDAGDALSPDPLSRFDGGATMVAAMRRAGVGALAVGNHDLSLGWEVLAARQAEAGFPFLAANLSRRDGRAPPLPGHVLLQAGDLKVGVLGVLAPGQGERIDPKIMEGLALTDPVRAADISARALREEGAACVIALVHMTETEALSFARRVADVDLVVAGGFDGLDRPDRVPGLVRLLNQTAVVTTPRYGLFLGRVDLRVRIDEDGRARVVGVSSEHIPIDASVAEDLETARMIADMERRYERVAGQRIGRIMAETVEAQGTIVAGLMRRHTRSEVGIVNQGGLVRVPPGQGLQVRDVDRFIRFDSHIANMTLTGEQLKAIAARSQRAGRPEARLIFVGFDPKEGAVNGRPVQNDERYRVATVGFLADGGDGYVEFRQGAGVAHTGISVRSLVVAALQDTSVALVIDDFSGRDHRGVWRANWGVEGAFNRNYIDGTTRAYRAERELVSFLSGETSVAWNASMVGVLAHARSRHLYLFENRVAFGQVGATFGDLDKSQDQVDADVTYSYRAPNWLANPFVSAGYSTAIASTDGQRPKLARGSTGFQKRFGGTLSARLGARAQRDFSADQSDLGVELGLDLRRSLGARGRLHSRMRSFLGLTDRRVVSLENYNTLNFPLAGSLSLAIRQNNFVYRVNKIRDVPMDGVAVRWDLTLGLVYDLGWKWY